MSPADRDLLLGAMHALRSYQHGNAAPDLARAIADDIERRLDRVPGRPSLTPNEDKVRAMMVCSPDRESMNAPGPLGIFARLSIAMREARGIAVARELDRSTAPTETILAFCKATAFEVVAMASGVGDGGLPAKLLMASIANHAERVERELATGSRPVEEVRLEPEPSA
ncbi:hypothetical protein [Enterovirga rhinocerotis]|uniref:Uncharacterized protein n=1 Tax=Enterovirga rhinocerotis TaxID=1339210 RepID=A0A4R7C7C1_9HYPH|nr:hypothetical protein [Enterovirga rhinocerotis]TDR94171.1 hypothetical protein EV668_1448 [Enterovirga rhinocerotis]